MITLSVQKRPDGQFNYKSHKPRDEKCRGKSISGIGMTLEQVIGSARRYFGRDDFIVRVDSVSWPNVYWTEFLLEYPSEAE
jgi:hypothetical protein